MKRVSGKKNFRIRLIAAWLVMLLLVSAMGSHPFSAYGAEMPVAVEKEEATEQENTSNTLEEIIDSNDENVGAETDNLTQNEEQPDEDTADTPETDEGGNEKSEASSAPEKETIGQDTEEQETTQTEEVTSEETEASEEITEQTADMEEPVVEESVTEEPVEEELPAEEEETEEEEKVEVIGPAFREEAEVDGVLVSVQAEENTFPEGSVLSVAKVESAAVQAEVDAAVEEQRDEEKPNVAVSYTFDIKVLNANGEEVQPAEGKTVKVSFTAKETSNDNLTTQIYHIEEEGESLTAKPLEVQEEVAEKKEETARSTTPQTEEPAKEVTATVETDGFSYYTVEFTYDDKQYVLKGGRYVRLSDILDFVGLTGEVESWEISNNELFTILRGDETGICEEYEWVGDDEIATPIDDPNGTVLYMLSLQAFDTEEWLKVVIDGIEYEIVVTDDNTSQNVPPGQYDGTGISTNLDNTPSTGVGEEGAKNRDELIHNATTPDYVKQSQSTTSATDFAAGLPLSTIFIDVSKIGNGTDNTAVQGDFTLLTNDPRIRAGFDCSLGNGQVVTYNPLLDTDNLLQLEPNKINVLEGDLFQFVYKDAAILPNGDKAHLKIVYSNAKIAIDQRLGITDTATGLVPSNYQGAVRLATGGSVARGGTDNRYLGTSANASSGTYNAFTQAQRRAMAAAVSNTTNSNWGITFTNSNANAATTPALGQSIDVTYQVVDDNDNPVNGTFIFAVTGINLDRDPYTIDSNNVAKPLWAYSIDDPYLHFFSEAMSINQGRVSDYIYVRPNTSVYESAALEQQGNQAGNFKYNYYYSHVIEDENGNPKFIGNNYRNTHGGNDSSYNSGFVLLVDATQGITVTSTGHGTALQGMNTQAYGGVQIWYRYTSFSGPNGTIQTTSEGNYGGTLDDTSDKGNSSNILDPNTYVVPEGKTITYTMTPNNGYQIAKLQVRNSSGALQEIKYNGKPLSTMEEGNICTFNDAAGRRCTLTALANGKFKLEVPYATHDEEIRVFWERTNAKVVVKKETVDNKEGTFGFKIKAFKKEDVVSYTPVQVGSIWRQLVTEKQTVTDPETGVETEIETQFYVYKTQFADDVTCTKTTVNPETGEPIPTQELIDDVSRTMLLESVVIPSDAIPTESGAYAWGQNLWKTNIKLSDLGITYGSNDDVLFVGFANLPSAPAGDTLDTALNTGYSAAGPERIYFYHPMTTVEEGKVTYWNFATGKGQENPPNPEWHSFTLANGDDEEFVIEQDYEYEVYEETPTGWELLSLDGVEGANKAIGYLSEQTHSAPEHTFLNRKLPDLEIKKTTDNNAPGSFEFTVKLTQAEISAQSYSVEATAVVENGVINYTFKNLGAAFSMNGVGIPAGNSAYVDGTLLRSVFDQLLSMDAGDGEKNITLGTDINGIVKTDETFKLKEWAEYQKSEQKRIIDEGGTPGPAVQMPCIYEFEAPGKPAGPYVMETPLPSGIAFVDPSDPSKGYKVTASNEEPFILTDLPHGVTYEVVETVPGGWIQLNAVNNTGDLSDDITADFTNQKLLELEIKKEVIDFDTNEEFTFIVRVLDNNQNPMDLSAYATAAEDGFYSFKLKRDETKPIGNIPYDYSYEVYELDSDGNKVSVGSDFNANSTYDTMWTLKSATNANKTIEEDTEAVFTNEIKRGDINIKKETKGNEAGEFKFKVKVWEEVEGTEKPMDLSDQLDDAGNDGYYEFTLNNGENLKIEDIPYGHMYEFDEETPSVWELVSIDGLTPRDKAEGIVKSDETKHTFLNAKKKTLTFTKKVTGNMGDKEDEFEFYVTISGWKTVYNDEIKEIFGAYYPPVPVGAILKNPTLNEQGIQQNYHINDYLYRTAIRVLADGSPVRDFSVTSDDRFTEEEIRYVRFSSSYIGWNAEDSSGAINFTGKTTAGIEYYDYLDLSEYGGEADDSEDEVIYVFRLKHGDTITIPDIPYGYTYRIWEEDYSGQGYKQKVDGATGTDVDGTLTEDKDHTFENNRAGAVPTEVRIAWFAGILAPIAMAVLVFRRLRRRRLLMAYAGGYEDDLYFVDWYDDAGLNIEEWL